MIDLESPSDIADSNSFNTFRAQIYLFWVSQSVILWAWNESIYLTKKMIWDDDQIPVTGPALKKVAPDQTSSCGNNQQ